MNSRQDYEHQEKDTDGFYYFFMNKDVECIDSRTADNNLKEFAKWWAKYKTKKIIRFDDYQSPLDPKEQ